MVKTYDPKKVSVVIAGFTMTGFAEGSFVKVDRSTPELAKHHVGAHGEVTRTLVTDNSGTITISLKASSPSNAVLKGLSKVAGSFPCSVFSRSDVKVSATASDGWVEKEPGDDFAGEEAKSEWVIRVADLTRIRLP